MVDVTVRRRQKRDTPRAAAEVVTQAESAVRAIRITLGALAIVVVATYRPLTGPPAWNSLLVTIAAIIATVLVLNAVSSRLRRTRLRVVVGQFYDILAIVGLASVLDGPLGQQTWALLLIPIISASVRLGSLAAMLTWAVGCLIYQGASWQGHITGLDNTALLIRAPGALLAIAITVGLLARWMREGWEIQNELTVQSTAREARLSVIESASRSLNHLSVREALEFCATQAVALGFDAATIHFPGEDTPRVAVGRCELVAQSAGTIDHDAEVLVTAWTTEDSIVVNSVAIVEPHTAAVLAAWSESPVDADQTQAFATLVAHTATAVTSASIRARLEDAAALDPLTSLANRRTFDQAVEQASAGPGPVALAFIDVDEFKKLNDTYGHLIGDKILVAIARRIESAVSDRCLVARFGGDEFVVLMPGATIPEARELGEAITRAMMDPIVAELTRIRVELSVGVAGGQTPISPMDLVRAGDKAAYQAKTLNRARRYANVEKAKIVTG